MYFIIYVGLVLKNALDSRDTLKKVGGSRVLVSVVRAKVIMASVVFACTLSLGSNIQIRSYFYISLITGASSDSMARTFE